MGPDPMPQGDWVLELMYERGVAMLPRDPVLLDFWTRFKMLPMKSLMQEL